MKYSVLVLGFLILATAAKAQDKFYTKAGKIDFYSNAPLEDITAKNKSVVCLLDTKTGTVQFSVLIKGFEFENEEMQDHFNEDYMESDQFPKAEFKGQIINNPSINYAKPGTYPAQVKGKLTLHGVTKEVQTNGTVKVDGNNLKAASTFTIQVADYNIKIPSLVKDKIAKTVKIVVDTKLDALK
jgi:polyisoprenoid-binding protein YceI